MQILDERSLALTNEGAATATMPLAMKGFGIFRVWGRGWHLAQVNTSELAVATVFSLVREVSVPLGLMDPRHPNLASTRWLVKMFTAFWVLTLKGLGLRFSCLNLKPINLNL